MLMASPQQWGAEPALHLPVLICETGPVGPLDSLTAGSRLEPK